MVRLVDLGFIVKALCVVLLLVWVRLAEAGAPIDPALQTLWHTNAFTCPASANWPAFPARRPTGGDICDDGDETIFHGLMCAAGMPEGCAAVKASQASDGRWYRSPRRAVVCANPAATPEERKQLCQNSFSPDMALGVQLYAHTTGDKAALGRWVEWIEANRPCQFNLPDGSCVKGQPRFCTDDTEGGCTLRPGDYATLAMSLEALGLVTFGDPGACPVGTSTSLKIGDFFLKGLCFFRPKARDVLVADALLNDPGYSQHLAGVGAFVLRKAKFPDGPIDPKTCEPKDSNDLNARVTAAKCILNKKQGMNPFFAFLAGLPHETVRNMTVALCPANQQSIPKESTDWAWQRKDAEQAWKKSMLWDCLFMAALLK